MTSTARIGPDNAVHATSDVAGASAGRFSMWCFGRSPAVQRCTSGRGLLGRAPQLIADHEVERAQHHELTCELDAIARAREVLGRERGVEARVVDVVLLISTTAASISGSVIVTPRSAPTAATIRSSIAESADMPRSSSWLCQIGVASTSAATRSSRATAPTFA